MHSLYGCSCSCIRIFRVFHVLIEAATTPLRQQVEFLRFYKIQPFILFPPFGCVCAQEDRRVFRGNDIHKIRQ